MSEVLENSTAPSFTSQESKITELFQLLHSSLKDQASQPSGVVAKNLKFLLSGDGNAVGCEQIGVDDGYVNYIYRLGGGSSSNGASVVVKWAREVMRVAEAENIDFGPEVTKYAKNLLARNGNECLALLQVEQLVPHSTPHIYWLDIDRHFFLMEDLSGYKTLRQKLTDGDHVEVALHNIAHFFGKLHGQTFVNQLSKDTYALLSNLGPTDILLDKMTEAMFVGGFQTDSKLPMIQADKMMYTEEMKKSGVLKQIIDNPDIKKVVKKLAEYFRCQICFVHNDSHPGAFMVSPEEKVKVIDFEFTTFGHPAKEIGYCLGEVVMFYHIYHGQGKSGLARDLVMATRSYLQTYLDQVGEILHVEVPNFWPIMAAHAGHFAAFRTVGSMLPFPQFQGLEQAEIECVRVATNLMKRMNDVNSVDDFICMGFPEPV